MRPFTKHSSRNSDADCGGIDSPVDMIPELAFIGDNDLPGIERDAQFAKNHGFAGIEYNFWHGINLADEAVAQMRSILDCNQVRAAMVGLWGLNHLSPDATERGKAHSFLDRAIEVAQKLGPIRSSPAPGIFRANPRTERSPSSKKCSSPFLSERRRQISTLRSMRCMAEASLTAYKTCEQIWQVFLRCG